MKRQTINVALYDGPRTVHGYVSPSFPGVAIHRSVEVDAWTATHIGSGIAVSGMFPLRRRAVEFATLACRMLDFTRSTEDIERYVARQPDLRSKLRELAARLKRN